MTLTPEKIQELREEAIECLIQEQEYQEPIFGADVVRSDLTLWKRWYLKPNQPHNYIRMTRFIPMIEGAIENPNWWVCYIQVWRRRKNEKKARMMWQNRIIAEAFAYISKMSGWEVEENGASTYSYLRSDNMENRDEIKDRNYKYCTIRCPNYACFLAEVEYSDSSKSWEPTRVMMYNEWVSMDSFENSEFGESYYCEDYRINI